MGARKRLLIPQWTAGGATITFKTTRSSVKQRQAGDQPVSRSKPLPRNAHAGIAERRPAAESPGGMTIDTMFPNLGHRAQFDTDHRAARCAFDPVDQTVYTCLKPKRVDGCLIPTGQEQLPAVIDTVFALGLDPRHKILDLGDRICVRRKRGALLFGAKKIVADPLAAGQGKIARAKSRKHPLNISPCAAATKHVMAMADLAELLPIPHHLVSPKT